MRILLCILLFWACTDGELDSHLVDPAIGSVPSPTPSPPGELPQVAICLKSCEKACGNYGAWSVLLPSTDTFCEEKEFDQSQSRTRTCVATCPDVQCQVTETKEVEADGTKDCPEPPPPCQTSCNTGCKAKSYSNWSPTESSQCKDKPVTQAREWTRECFSTCDDKAECLCTGIKCEPTGTENQPANGTKVIACNTACDAYSWGEWLPQKDAAEVCKGESVAQTRSGTRTCPRDDCSACGTKTTQPRTLKGTKVTPCQEVDNSPYCNAWQPVSGAEGVWSPARNTKSKGEEFEQTREEKRTCPRACPNSFCKKTRTVEQWVFGTKEDAVKKTPAPKPVVQPTCNQCSTGCEKWDNWGAWTVEASCPTSIDFGVELLKEGKDNRIRTRVCNNNLCADAVCFTSNTETRTIPCICPEGKVLAAKGTCVCDTSKRKYRKGNKCEECPKGNNFEQVKGVWTCEPTPCDDCCDVDWSKPSSDWGQPTSVSIKANEVCENSEFTPKLTYTRDCSSCSAGMTCEETTTVDGTKTDGTKTTECKDHCTEWSDNWSWTTTSTIKTCDKNSFDKHSITQSGTKTRECNEKELCSPSDCDEIDATGSKTEECAYCMGTGQVIVNKGTATEKCECDERARYYRAGDTCAFCPKDKELENGQCIKVVTEETTVLPPEEEEHDNCADGCDDWDMTTDWTWKTAEKCTADTSLMEKPKLEAEEATRTRTRTCKNLQPGLKCFTENTETRTTTCAWCQGTGMEKLAKGQMYEGEVLTEDKCVCDYDNGYYEKNGKCAQCSEGEKLVKEKDGTRVCKIIPTCDDCTVTWGDWIPAVSDMCKDKTFTAIMKGVTECDEEGLSCPNPDPQEEDRIGTKVIDCDNDCGDWSAWSDGIAGKTCPTKTPLGSNPDIIGEQTQTRICPSELCGKECSTSESKKQTKTCDCTGEGQTKYMDGTCRILTAETEIEPPEPECKKTCEAGCTWSGWTTPPSCSASSSFTAPSSWGRNRTASCNNLCNDVKCFTSNTETHTCAWCKGEGQKLDEMGVCVCDGSRNYYKGKGDDEKDKCIYCFGKKVNVEGNACVCEASSCINDKKEWDSTTCECGECKQEHVNECMGKGRLNTTNCECVVEPEPETTEINVYRGCFTQSNSALYMPLDEDLLGKTQKWRVGCFDSEQDYVTAANSLHNASGNAEEIVQKLYDCATKYDKISIKINKDSFIDELFNEARECNRGNLNPNDVINAEIKL